MLHVTFRAGATSRSVVPETDGLAASGPRGALRYFFARALGGKSAKDGVTTRQALFGYLKPNIRGATQDRQLIQVEPQSPESSICGKAVLSFAGAAPAAQAANTPPAPGDGPQADDGAAPPAQALNTPPPSDGSPPDKASTLPAQATDTPLPLGYGPPPAQAPTPPTQASNTPAPADSGSPAAQAPTPPSHASSTPPPPDKEPSPDQSQPPPTQATNIPLPPGYGPPSGQGAARSDTIRVALIDATDKAWDTIEKGNAPFERSPSRCSPQRTGQDRALRRAPGQ
jgi:hypothetical protein